MLMTPKQIAGIIMPSRAAANTHQYLAMMAAHITAWIMLCWMTVVRSIADDLPDQQVLSAFLWIDSKTNEMPDRKPQLDLYGDPLPFGATARLGTVRYRISGLERSVHFLSDGNTFAAGSQESGIRFFDVRTGRQIGEIQLGAPELRLSASSISRTGEHFVALASLRDPINRQATHYCKVWKTSTKAEIAACTWKGEYAQRIAISPDGSAIAIATQSGVVRLWQTASEEEHESTTFGTQPVSIEFSPDGKTMVVCSIDDVSTWQWGTATKSKSLGKFERALTAIFSPDGSKIAVGLDGRNAAIVLNSQTGERLQVLRGNGRAYSPVSLAFTSNGGQLIVPVASKHAIEFFNLNTGVLEKTVEAGPLEPHGISISPDGKYLATSADPEIRIWTLPEQKDSSSAFNAHSGQPRIGRFTVDGQRVVSGGMDGTIRVWNARDGKLLQAFAHEPQELYSSMITAIEISPDGNQIFSASFDDTVRVWDIATKKQILKLAGHGRLGSSAAFDVKYDPSKRQLLSIGPDMFLRTWDLNTGRALTERRILPSGLGLSVDEEGNVVSRNVENPFDESGDSPLSFAQISHNTNALLVSIGTSSYVVDTTTGREVQRFEVGAFGSFTGANLSQDDSILAVSLNNPATIEIRDIPSGYIRLSIDTKANSGVCPVFSQDNRLLAVHLYENPNGATTLTRRVSIFRVEDGREVYRINNVTAGYMFFSPDANRLAVICNDSSILIYDLAQFRLP